MATNILSLPLVEAKITTFTNEDLRETFVFRAAAQAVGYPNSQNVGGGLLGGIVALPGAAIGDFVVTIRSIEGTVTTYSVDDPSGTVIGAGVLGVPFSGGGLSFNLRQAGTPLIVGDNFSIAVLGGPLDISGIDFTMMVRQAIGDNPVLMTASTPYTMVNGAAGGQLGIAVPLERIPEPGNYVYDVVAFADDTRRLVCMGQFVVAKGVSIPPVIA